MPSQRKGQVGGFDKESFRGRFVTGMNESYRTSNETGQEFRRRATAYDPYEAVRTAATGAFEELRPELERSVEDLRGQQVAMGRLNTGFANEDEDRLVEGAFRNLNNEVARNSVAAAGLDLQGINALGAFSQHARDQYLDLVAGGLDHITAEENAKKQKRGGLFGALGSIVGGVGGFVLSGGNPIGAYAGAKAGGSIGRGIGG